jgi:hypothetical protein
MLSERAASIVWRQGQIKHELFEMTRPFFWRRAANPAGRPAGATHDLARLVDQSAQKLKTIVEMRYCRPNPVTIHLVQAANEPEV